jgi:chromosome segregation ATPase
MAQQFAAHENASSEKIFSLEQKIRALVAEKEASVFVDKTGCYDAETVHRLSSGVLEQSKEIEFKEKQISQLKLRLEVLKRTLHEKEESHHTAKRHWEEERTKLHNCLTSSEKKSLFTLQQELFESRAALNNALSDIDALTAALESNNEALDASVEELEILRDFKSRHSKGEEVQASVISRTVIPTLSSSSKQSDVSILQSDVECSLKELNELRELLVKADGKSYHDLKAEVHLLQEELNAARLDAKFASQRIEQLTSEVQTKSDEVTKLRQDLATFSTDDSKEKDRDVENTKVASSPDSEYWSKDLKDFSIVADLENKIVELERKLDAYENPPPAEKEEGLNEDTQNLPMTPNKEQKELTETPDSTAVGQSKWAPPESPLTARKLFQPLRRGWATSSPLIKNPLVDTSEPRGDLAKEKDAAKLNDIIKANTEVMEKLKRDIIKIQTEKEETEYEMNQLKEENAAYAAQVAVLEKAFREMNDQRASDGDGMTDDGSVATETPTSPSVLTSQELDLQSKNMALQRSITEMESSQSHQEDEIERLKSELVKMRVISQQEKDAALQQVTIVTAQKIALENQLIEINKSAGILRDSLSDQVSSPKKGTETTCTEPASSRSTESGGAGGSDPVLVAQVVMLENANKVLENSVTSLRSDLQEKLTPLLERVSMLEEEKRIIEDEMNVKLQCREMTIKNLENSLQQLNATRFSSGKKKRHTKVESPLPSP